MWRILAYLVFTAVWLIVPVSPYLILAVAIWYSDRHAPEPWPITAQRKLRADRADYTGTV